MNLKIVARAGVGLDNIDQGECEKRGIKVLNTPGASRNAVAELALGLIICTMRNVQKAHLQMKNKNWDKKHLIGHEIEGKTLGIIGYGRIGKGSCSWNEHYLIQPTSKA
jgi:D-3-phosphoglycerate dehydrogenase